MGVIIFNPFRPSLPFAADALALDELAAAVGAGDALAGKKLLADLANNLVRARAKHPRFAGSNVRALAVIGAEYDELCRATPMESARRQYEEALDVAVTALRFANEEYDKCL